MVQWEYCRATWILQVVSKEEQRSLLAAGFRGEFRETTDAGGASTTAANSGLMRVSSLPADQTESFTDLDGMLTRLGREGWELVACTQINQSVSHWIFKRPIPS